MEKPMEELSMFKAICVTNEKVTQKIKPFLTKATIAKLRCVDERPEKIKKTGEKGVQFPGGYYGIIDAIKYLTGCTEEEARMRAQKANIPLGIHDDEHHGALGCGYGKLVQTEPATVLAPEAVDVHDRFAYVNAQEGSEVLTLTGDHNPIYAVVNYQEGTTVNSPAAVAAGVGSFNYDYWAGMKLGKQLGLGEKKFADHLLTVYQNTVMRLTNGAITTFYNIR